MSQPVIIAEQLSKWYRRGGIGQSSAREDINHWWRRLTRMESPDGQEQFNSAQQLWALQKIDFNLMPAEVLGFAGKNGAGKSTLLKILSKVTMPSGGRILGRGRIASLLEAGTGFHRELSGRENIYLNGNILGMKKKDIDRKFDQIVAFSGAGAWLETPVKRYSSGLYVRLAFAVAAHLEPDILIVDEVLSLSDAGYQRKCMQKMLELSSQQGGSIILVSHNAQLMNSCCHRIITLDQGRIVDEKKPVVSISV